MQNYIFSNLEVSWNIYFLYLHWAHVLSSRIPRNNGSRGQSSQVPPNGPSTEPLWEQANEQAQRKGDPNFF